MVVDLDNVSRTTNAHAVLVMLDVGSSSVVDGALLVRYIAWGCREL